MKRKVQTEFFIWQYGEEKNATSTFFRFEVNCNDGRVLKGFETQLKNDGWTSSAYGYSKSVFTREFTDRDAAQAWTRTFPHDVIYIDRNDKQKVWNRKRGRPKKKTRKVC